MVKQNLTNLLLKIKKILANLPVVKYAMQFLFQKKETLQERFMA